jgi:hypothetical protein
MCPNLAKFLLGSDKIWLKFAIEYLDSLLFLEVEILHQLVGEGGTHGRGGEAIRCYRRVEMVFNVLRSIIHVRLARDCLSGLLCCYACFTRCLQLFESPRAVVDDDLRIYYLYIDYLTLGCTHCKSATAQKTQEQNGPHSVPTYHKKRIRYGWGTYARTTCLNVSLQVWGERERERERERASGK